MPKQFTSIFATVLTKVSFARQKKRDQKVIYHHNHATTILPHKVIAAENHLEPEGSEEPVRVTMEGADSGYGSASASFDRKQWLRNSMGTLERDRKAVEDATAGVGHSGVSPTKNLTSSSSTSIATFIINEDAEQPPLPLPASTLVDDNAEQSPSPTSTASTRLPNEDAEQCSTTRPTSPNTPTLPSQARTSLQLHHRPRVSFDASSRYSGRSAKSRSVRSRRRNNARSRSRSFGTKDRLSEETTETLYYSAASEFAPGSVADLGGGKGGGQVAVVADTKRWIAGVAELQSTADVERTEQPDPRNLKDPAKDGLKRLSWQTFSSDVTDLELELPPPPADQVLPVVDDLPVVEVSLEMPEEPMQQTSTEDRAPPSDTHPQHTPAQSTYIPPRFTSPTSSTSTLETSSIASHRAVITSSRSTSLDSTRYNTTFALSETSFPSPLSAATTLNQSPTSRPPGRERFSNVSRSEVDWTQILHVPDPELRRKPKGNGKYLRGMMKWAKRVIHNTRYNGGASKSSGGMGLGTGKRAKEVVVGVDSKNLWARSLDRPTTLDRKASTIPTPSRPIPVATPLPMPTIMIPPPPKKTTRITFPLRTPLRRSISLHSMRHNRFQTTTPPALKTLTLDRRSKRASIDVVSTRLRRLYYDVVVKGVDLTSVIMEEQDLPVSESDYDEDDDDVEEDEGEAEGGHGVRKGRKRGDSFGRRSVRSFRSGKTNRTMKTVASGRTLTSILTGSDVVVALRYVERGDEF
ncbi:hypothetical protein HK097_001536 [Rhizophlyctis rosea]|uniref:Uncharacterized protein n=1 Tax=Rhizophlyctis rosea TaxID=64517 RepID=A0AAD5S764_9FUNG|nr:hypothetical protein HK097_001536 [Rhizophlyctis rosea]